MSDLVAFHFIAYLDPGTGSLIVQFLLGAIVGTGVWFRKHVLATVARLFRFGRKPSGEAPAGDTEGSAAAEAARAQTAPESAEVTSDATPAKGADVAAAEQEEREDTPVATR